MKAAELAAYARQTYGITCGDPAAASGFLILRHPRTGRRVALIRSMPDGGLSRVICRIRCGKPPEGAMRMPCVTYPVPGEGPDWADVALTDETDTSLVLGLFDRAMELSQDLYTIVLERLRSAAPQAGDTPLPFFGTARDMAAPSVPERIRQMRRLYVYASQSLEGAAENFRRQAAFMEDYEDDYPWKGDVRTFYPTYHDLSAAQLRGYFSWRTRVRKGDYGYIPPAAAYLYIYEILNGIGAEGPQDALKKLRAFEKGFGGAGYGDQKLWQDLHAWMLSLAVVNGLPKQAALECADRDLIEFDSCVLALRRAQDESDETVYRSLSYFGKKILEKSPVVRRHEDRAARLFSRAWRHAAASYARDGKGLFELCFSDCALRPWYPFANAPVPRQRGIKPCEYELDECRRFRSENGRWLIGCYETARFDRGLFHSFLRETDRILRLYLKAGRPLKPDPGASWAVPFAAKACAEDRRDEIEKARPRVAIDLSGLEKIRQDALLTQSRLLVPEGDEESPDPALPEEGPAGAENAAAEPVLPKDPVPPENTGGLPLDGVLTRVLRRLLEGKDASDILAGERLMPSLAADSINEALLDLIGDNAVTCDGGALCIVSDYIDDITRIVGGVL